MLSQIKAIVFDLGGVLIKNPNDKMRRYFAKVLGVKVEDFCKVYEKLERQFQKGIISENKLWDTISNKLKIERPKIKFLWRLAFVEAYQPRKSMFSLALKLHNSGYKTGIVSNTELPVTKYLYRQKEYGIFDILIFSCEVGMVKPERGIYELMLKKLELKNPAEVVFIDDKKEYIREANALGINTILFQNVNQVKKELRLLLSVI